MQWNQPGSADRPRVLLFAGTGAVFGYALAFGLMAAVLRGVPWYPGTSSASWLNRISIGAMAVLVLGLATLCADILVKVRRGPRTRTRRVLRSEDGTLLVALLAISLAMLAFATGGADAMLNGRADTRIFGWLLIASLGSLGGVCLLGAFVVGWNAIVRGPSTLTLEGTHVAAGLPLTAVLEIPFAAAQAPAVTIAVELTRWEAPVSGEDPTSSSTAWSERVRVDEWKPTGSRRASTKIRYEIPEGAPADLSNPRVSYVWSLDVRPVADVAWNAQFTLPIAFVEDAAQAA